MLGPYELLSPLDTGIVCEVYRASDTELDRDVAVKVRPAEPRKWGEKESICR